MRPCSLCYNHRMNHISHDSETPAFNQQVFTACAFIHETFDGVDKVFLPKRADTKKFLPGVYELPGGHIDFGEEMVVGLAREIDEEFGMDVAIGDPFYVFTYTNPIKGSHSIEVIYFARFTTALGKLAINPEDHSEFGWFSEAELENAANPAKGSDDLEFQAISKGFALLRGESLQF
jgi:8-oxo-dGTP diphosphatase